VAPRSSEILAAIASRQPEAAGKIQTAALILAAFIEGAALFGIVVAFSIQGKF
jgi:F-type H+-transporting ATPase subunit c